MRIVAGFAKPIRDRPFQGEHACTCGGAAGKVGAPLNADGLPDQIDHDTRIDAARYVLVGQIEDDRRDDGCR